MKLKYFEVVYLGKSFVWQGFLQRTMSVTDKIAFHEQSFFAKYNLVWWFSLLVNYDRSCVQNVRSRALLWQYLDILFLISNRFVLWSIVSNFMNNIFSFIEQRCGLRAWAVQIIVFINMLISFFCELFFSHLVTSQNLY